MCDSDLAGYKANPEVLCCPLVNAGAPRSWPHSRVNLPALMDALEAVLLKEQAKFPLTSKL